jgi:uncharacterized damage-inducible protein DinB
MQTLKEQYQLVLGSREVLLSYLDTIKPDDLKAQIENSNKRNIRYLAVHIANTYIFWLGKFAFKRDIKYIDEDKISNVNEIRKGYDEVNQLMEEFLNHHSDYNTPVEGEIFWLKKNMTFTVLELLTHVMTHEFHHKGQIMTMGRMFGYKPPDADIIRF